MKVGIIAALPREVAGVVKGWETRCLPDHVMLYTRGNSVVACAGMGAARVTLAVEAAMAAMPISDLLSVGLAGACDPALHIGEIVRAGLVIDSRTGEQFSESQYRQVLVTTDFIASVSEKARLHASYHASAVDMEAATVGRLARAHGLAFQAIKAISDEANFELDKLSRFSTPDGQFREGAFALHAALHPKLWRKTITLSRNSSKALATLTVALNGELDWYRKRAY
jgi:adenosylhomocysteine nucleosidase